MKHLKTLLIVFLAAAQTATAQQSENTQKSVYVEVLGASNLVGVNFDSRFKPNSPWDYLEFVVPFDLCHINGHYVVVSHRSVFNFRQTPITLSEKVYRCYEKKLFPKQYEERENKVERGFILCSSDYCYLTFLGDSLINKSYHHGMRRDKILIKLNGREVYL